MIQRQTIVAALPADTVRLAKSLVGKDRPYSDLTELIEVALANQMQLEGALSQPSAEPAAGQETSRLLLRPNDVPLLVPEVQARGPLSAFTNRLFPVKLSCRVLANVDPSLSLRSFQDMAAQAARGVGLRLRDEDSQEGRKGIFRRWVALPVGAKGASTMNRFINHFTLTAGRGGVAGGPMVALGLGNLDSEGQPRLTDLGWHLAREANPVLDGDQGGSVAQVGTLAVPERELFVRALTKNSKETIAIVRFREAVEAADGLQRDVDAVLESTTPAWSGDQAAAHRAAMIGRLHDLGAVRVENEGPEARISFTGEFDRLSDEAGHDS